MDIKDLRFFVAVYETKGFSRASEQLGTVQSNVSARIGGLEDVLGVPLSNAQSGAPAMTFGVNATR